jgi:hypothetical protein
MCGTFSSIIGLQYSSSVCGLSLRLGYSVSVGVGVVLGCLVVTCGVLSCLVMRYYCVGLYDSLFVWDVLSYLVLRRPGHLICQIKMKAYALRLK